MHMPHSVTFGRMPVVCHEEMRCNLASAAPPTDLEWEGTVKMRMKLSLDAL